MYVYDTETCGLHGMPVLLQYWKTETPDEDIKLYEIWQEPVWKTLALVRDMMEKGVIGFNLAFDHFQLCKLYTIWSLLPGDWLPRQHIKEIAHLEPLGRDGLCLKPSHALDLMMYARKGPYQSTMDRKPICVRRVPRVIAQTLVDELESRVELKPIYFAKRKDKRAAKWAIYDCKDRKTGEIDPHFVNVMLKFRPSSSLKAIAEDMFGGDKTKFADIQPERRPLEIGYAPFALAMEPSGNFKETWPGIIHDHIAHWRYRQDAREYAKNDIVYTRGIWRAWDSPEPDDDDSVLTCMVAACRWRGYAVDIQKLVALKKEKQEAIKAAPRSAQRVKSWLWPDLGEAEKSQLKKPGSTCKVNLEDMCKWLNDDGTPHKVAAKAAAVMEARRSEHEVKLLDKLILAGRFHASFIVIGALSSRMSGGDGDLNSQGIKRTKEVRRCFPLAFRREATENQISRSLESSDRVPPTGDLTDTERLQVESGVIKPGMLEIRKQHAKNLGVDFSKWHKDSREALFGYILCGGDFESFEVTIADAVWGDPKLHEDLQSGKSIHGIFGTFVYPGMSYEEIMATKGSKVVDIYNRCKSAVFAMMYGGEGYTLMSRLGVDEETANRAYMEFSTAYSSIRRQQDMLTSKFCTITQPGGIGTKVYWRDPDDYIETVFGDRRYFTVENVLTKILFDLSEKPPRGWSVFEGTVKRYEKEQRIPGAVKSALYGAAFNMQSGIKRAAGNHLIQSAGARITKRVQTAVWALQPTGIHPWLVQPMNVHDELMCPVRQNHTMSDGVNLVDLVKSTVDREVESFRSKIPLIGMEWSTSLSSWADK